MPEQQRLSFFDQLAFELHRLTGRNQLMQCLWIYDTDVNREALEAVFARMLVHRGNRLIEPSALPFGRPRWVRDDRPQVSVQYGDAVLPRAQLMTWANAHARLPIDPIAGPAWYLAVQGFDDGTHVISMFGSHLLSDGIAALRGIESVIVESPAASPYQTRRARGALTGVVADVGQACRDIPRTVGAVAKIAGLALRQRRRVMPAVAEVPAAPVVQRPIAADAAQIVNLPAVTVVVAVPVWNARAAALGGHLQSLLVAYCARVAMHLQRRRPADGAVSLVIPVDQRDGPTDDRALAMGFRSMTLDPESVTEDLGAAHAALTSALNGTEKRNSMEALLPIIAWMPRATTAAMINRLFNYASARPVTCSNIGELPTVLGRIDGTPCRRLIARAVDVHVTRGELERTHGHLVIVASRYNDHLSIAIEAYETGADYSVERLRDIAFRALADFGLDGQVES